VIKAKRIQDVREILAGAGFADWCRRYHAIYEQLSGLRARDPDRLTRTILRAGEYEDLAHQAATTYSRLDTSFETLAQYEQQRINTSAFWEELGRAEYQLAEYRQTASELRASLAAARKGEQTPAGSTETDRLEMELTDAERLVEEWDKQAQEARDRLDRETEHRDGLWQIVEEAWLRAFRANMARIEYGFLGRRARADQEALALAGEGKSRDNDSGAIEAEEMHLAGELGELLREAETEYDCVAIAEFLYWPHQDDMRAALCVPLVGDMHHLNIQVTRRQIYRIERAKGLKFLEPLPKSADDDDIDGRRLESFFAERPQRAAAD
jgi:phage shock protein A